MGLALPPFLMGGANGIKGHNAASNNNDSSSESEDWAEESWTVDCPCGVNFDDGEEMVQCDECEVWVHTACCQVIKSVDIYVCDKCKEKKRKEHEESEVAQLLVELPGKSVSFDDRSNEMLLGAGQSSYGSIERRAHEHGVPGGDSSMFLSSGVFSQQLWKCSGYVPKVLQVQYCEFPEWGSDSQAEPGSLFDAGKQAGKLKKVKQEGFEDRLKLPAPGKKLELNRPGGKQQKQNKFRGMNRDEKPPQQTYSKRSREEVKEHYSRKKVKTSPEVVKVENPKRSSSSQQQSPKNPKAMKKSAVQEFMDVDTRACSKCLKPEPVTSNDDQGNLSKPLVCQECQKSRQGVPSSKKPVEMEECKKSATNERATTSHNLSPETASTELPTKPPPERSEPVEPEKKSQEGGGESTGSHQSSKQQQQQQQQRPGLMKPPDDIQVYHRRSTTNNNNNAATTTTTTTATTDASVEQKVLQGCQLSVRTSSFSKSEIPSPASINSGGPSGANSGPKTTSPGSPTSQKGAVKPPGGKVAVKASAAAPPGKSSSTSKASAAAAVPGFKKSEGRSSSGALSSTKTSSSSQPGLKQCKSSGSNSGLKSGQLLRKPGLSGQKSGSGSKDAGERVRDDRSSLLRSSPPGSATAAAAAAVPLNDEELAMLLHQELNSSPRVPRVPRVRQAAAAISSAQPSNILTKRALGGAHSASQKEHRLMWRKRHRDDLKESSRKYEASSHSSKHRNEEGSKSDEDASSSRDSSESSEGRNEDDNPVSSKKQQGVEAEDGEKESRR